jgi:hypothetical protein
MLRAQVPMAGGLTIRVINNVTKKMDVKPKFYEAFRKDGYPASFEFRQKARPPLLCSNGNLMGC